MTTSATGFDRVNVYVEIICRTDGAEGLVPRWARINFTRELEETLLRMERGRVEGRFDRVAIRWSPDEFGPCDEAEELRTEAEFLVVELFGERASFYFEAREKFSQAVMESVKIDLVNGLESIGDGRRYFGYSMDDDGFREEVANATNAALPDDPMEDE